MQPYFFTDELQWNEWTGVFFAFSSRGPTWHGNYARVDRLAKKTLG